MDNLIRSIGFIKLLFLSSFFFAQEKSVMVLDKAILDQESKKIWVSFYLKNGEAKKYYFLQESFVFETLDLENNKGNHLSYYISNDEGEQMIDEITVHEDLTVNRINKAFSKKEIRKLLRKNKRKDRDFVLYNSLLKNNKFILTEDEKKSYDKLEIDVKHIGALKKSNKYYLQLVYTMDSTAIKKYLKDEELKSLSDESIRIFDGTIISNKLPLIVCKIKD